MPTNNYKDIADAESDGFTFVSGWRKQPTQTTGAGIWFDLSMSPGNPVPNYYFGTANTFTPLRQSADGGIPHGANVSPKTKYLRVFEAQTNQVSATPTTLHLLDYLGFYPFLDESVLDEQFMVNTVPVPRLSGGAQLMPVVVFGQTGGQTFKVGYTNQNGVSGRYTLSHIMGTQSTTGTIITSAGVVANTCAPFMQLQQGDSAVQKVDSIIFEGAGDIGLMALAMVRPISKHYIRGIDAPNERDCFADDASLPIIQDDAYLNLISLPTGTLAGAPILGYIKTLWT